MKVKKLFSKLFESRQMAHVFHLQVKSQGSYASHKALEDYYESINDNIDSLVEMYQAQYGIVEEYDVIDSSTSRKSNPLEYFEDLVQFLKEERSCINSDDTHLHNVLDEITSIAYRTIYKLKFLS